MWLEKLVSGLKRKVLEFRYAPSDARTRDKILGYIHEIESFLVEGDLDRLNELFAKAQNLKNRYEIGHKPDENINARLMGINYSLGCRYRAKRSLT
jgi:hypothetical protein